MKNIHPDVVVGEPISEVEPRVDLELYALLKKSNRRSRWCVAGLLVVYVVLALFQPSRWVVYPVVCFIIAAWFRPLHAFGKKRQERVQFRGKAMAIEWGFPLRDYIEFMAHGFSGGIVVQTMLTARGGFSGLSISVGIMGIIGGICLIALGRVARQPGQICCVDCEYPLVGLTIPCGCPECGRRIDDPSRTTDRVRVRSRWFLWGGLGICVLGLSIGVGSFFRPPFYYGLVTQGGLNRLAMTDSRAFDRLVGAPMAAQDTDELIEKLIAANEGADGWGVDMAMQGLWLDQFLGSDMISQEQLDRILERAVGPIHIEGASSARVGDAIRVKLVSERVEFPGVKFKPRYFIRGFQVGDVLEFEHASTSAGFLENFYRDRTVDIADRYSNPSFLYTATEAGSVVVRVRVVLAVFPLVRHKTMNIEWGGDEELAFETEPIWYRVLDLEHRIVVEP